MRFILALALACLLLGHAPSAGAADTIVVTDVAGRQVKVNRPVTRILLGEGRQLMTLSLIHPDPVSILAGWPADFSIQDPTTYNRYRERFPGLDKVPVVGRVLVETFSIEKALSIAPDIAIFSGGYGPSVNSAEIVTRLEAAGIPVVFLDLIAKPIENTTRSIAILGRILDREREAKAYIDFYDLHLRRIADRLAQAKPTRPKVFMHGHAGLGDCCASPNRTTIGAFIDAAGGHNIAADVLKQPFGQISVEYILSRAPDVYVGTGGIHLKGKGGLVMGPGIRPDDARHDLERIVARPDLAELPAVRNHRVYGIWHIFNNNPANFLAVEALAKWFHPDLFADVDPDQSLRELNDRFLPVPMEGTYWIALDRQLKKPNATAP